MLFSIPQKMMQKVKILSACKNQMYEGMEDGIGHGIYFLIEYVDKQIKSLRAFKATSSYNYTAFIANLKYMSDAHNLGNYLI